jgi:glycosyltransferase involved in cell wall biosynthesis
MSEGANRPTISFCTTCMGRRHHLERLYRRNVELALTYERVEFVLLDYGSTDGLRDWVERDLRRFVEQRIVHYHRTAAPRLFHMAHAKNVAHRLASGDVVVNLDADNWFARGFTEEIGAAFANGERIIALFRAYRAGCTGRIALRRADFLALGGYDEDLSGWGFEDADLVRRARRFGLERRYLDPRHAHALQHSDEERMRFAPNKDKHRQRRENEWRSAKNLAALRFVANRGREWGTCELERSA